MEQLSEAISHLVENQRDLMLDPVSVIIVVGIVVAFAVLRLLGRRKSTRQRIAEMEDADFPVDDVPPPGDSSPD